VLSGTPLPFKIVFAIELEVLPADLGLVAASEIGSVEALNIVVSKSVAITSICFRLLFMEPPGPLATGDWREL
jgi:hypothetical protein